MTFDEYWEEAQHHVNAEYHAALEVWKASRYETLKETQTICRQIGFDQRRSPLATDGALMCVEKIVDLMKELSHE